MRNITITLLSLVFTACATPMQYTYQETCGLKDMVLAGVDTSVGSSQGGGVIYSDGQVIPVSTSETITTEVVRCNIPKTSKEICEAKRAAKVAAPKSDYNDNIQTKRWVAGIGYAALIVPGVTAKLIYDHKASEAKEASSSIDGSLPKCE